MCAVKNRQSQVYVFDGDVTLSSIASVGDAFLKAFRGGSLERIDIMGVTAADLTFVQFIESARRAAAAKGQTIRLEKPAEGAVLQVLQRGGFLGADDADRLNFWSGGKTQS